MSKKFPAFLHVRSVNLFRVPLQMSHAKPARKAFSSRAASVSDAVWVQNRCLVLITFQKNLRDLRVSA
jgi:hypothetical protein